MKCSHCNGRIAIKMSAPEGVCLSCSKMVGKNLNHKERTMSDYTQGKVDMAKEIIRVKELHANPQITVHHIVNVCKAVIEEEGK